MSQDLGSRGISDYKNALYFTTLGSFASGSSQCQNVRASDVDLALGDSITFSCEVGTIGSFDTFEYGVITETQDITCDYYTHFSWSTTCNDKDTSAIKAEYESNCEGKSSCSFNVKSTYFDYNGGCASWDPIPTNSANKNRNFYFNILCQGLFLISWILTKLAFV